MWCDKIIPLTYRACIDCELVFQLCQESKTDIKEIIDFMEYYGKEKRT